MNCAKIQQNLSAFIDSELDSSQITTMKAHLIRCPKCRLERDRIDRIGTKLRELEPMTTPPDFEYKIYAGIRNRVTNINADNRFNWKMILAPVTALAIGIFIGSFYFHSTAIPVAENNSQQMERNASEYLSTLPVTTDSEGLKEYTIDTYVADYSAPIPVNTIPDHPGDLFKRNQNMQQDQYWLTHSRSDQYVLDQMPIRVTYERTIY